MYLQPAFADEDDLGTDQLQAMATRSERAVADMFNSAVAAAAIGAAWEVGALDELERSRVLHITEFAAARRLHEPSVRAMLRALASVGAVSRHGDLVRTAEHFVEVCRTRAFFHWLVRGSGGLFQQMPHVLRTPEQVGHNYRRDATAISYACLEISERCFDPAFWAAVDNVDFEPGLIADLGSGSGNRLLQLADRFPGSRGIGLEIAQPAIDMAAAAVAERGLSERVTFVEADVCELEHRAEFDDVELLTCFLMGHDFWPKDRCVRILRRLRAIFPNAQRFILGDTARTTGIADRALPVFTLGFEVAHSMMGVRLPSLAEWDEVFSDSGWRCAERRLIERPAASVVFELV